VRLARFRTAARSTHRLAARRRRIPVARHFQLSASALAIRRHPLLVGHALRRIAHIVDYVAGRAGIYVDYEALLGDEFRLFDPNQGNYTLEANASGRIGPKTEVVDLPSRVAPSQRSPRLSRSRGTCRRPPAAPVESQRDARSRSRRRADRPALVRDYS